MFCQGQQAGSLPFAMQEVLTNPHMNPRDVSFQGK